MRHRNLKVLRAYLHLRSLHRVVVIFPGVPSHSFTTDLAVEVQTIQVGLVEIVVPPGAFKNGGAVGTTGLVIITILQW